MSATSLSMSGPGSFASGSSVTQDCYLIIGDMMKAKPEKVHGLIGFRVQDVSDIKSIDSGDKLDYGLARIHVPSDNSVLSIRFTGLDYTGPKSAFGGVGLLKTMFGDSGVGDSNMPRTLAFVEVNGFVDLTKDGRLIGSHLPANICVVPGIYDTKTESLVSSSEDIDYNVRQIALGIHGPIAGLTDSDLLIGWPQAALNFRNAGGAVLTASEVDSIALIGAPPMMTAVAGEVVQLPQNVYLSLRPGGIRPSDWTLAPGYTKITVTNNSPFSRGVIVKGKDLIGQPFIRYTPVLRPGRSATLHVFLNPGSLVVTEFSRFGATRAMPVLSQFRSILVVGQ
jgi:hypothetical protein